MAAGHLIGQRSAGSASYLEDIDIVAVHGRCDQQRARGVPLQQQQRRRVSPEVRHHCAADHVAHHHCAHHARVPQRASLLVRRLPVPKRQGSEVSAQKEGTVQGLPAFTRSSARQGISDGC